jgi:spermidine/putrescine transport system permease protein
LSTAFCFNGANSRVLVRDTTGELIEADVTLTGQNDLKPGEEVSPLSGPPSRPCALPRRGPVDAKKDIKRLSLILLFAPFALWITLLIILPHIGMVTLSLRKRVAPRVYEYGFGNYIDFLNEPIYWNTLLRTGSMSLLVTALALLIGFPIAYYIAKIAGQPHPRCPVPALPDPALGERPDPRVRLDPAPAGNRCHFLFPSMDRRDQHPIEFLYNDVTVIIGLVYTVMLFMIVPLVSTLDGMDNSMIEAGYNLGGNGFTVLAGSSSLTPCPASFPAASWCSC